MDVDFLVVLCVLGLLLALIFLDMPIAAALGVSATVGIFWLQGFSYTWAALASIPISTIVQNGLIVIPLFVLMGYLALNAGIAHALFDLAARAFGKRMPGGLGIAAVAASAAFAGITGSSAATIASVGTISYKEMRDHGYRPSFAGGIIAMSGTLGIMIPPSSFLVLYAILAKVSIRDILIAGIVPGLMSAMAYAAVVYFRCLRDPSLEGKEPRGKKGYTTSAATGFTTVERKPKNGLIVQQGTSPLVVDVRESKVSRLGVFGVGLIFLVVIGGMYGGLFTAIEASAVGAVSALILCVVLLRAQRQPTFSAVTKSFRQTISVTSMIGFLLIGGGLLSYFLVLAHVPSNLTRMIMDVEWPGWVLMAVLLLMLLPLGMFLDGTSLLLIITPLIVPLVDVLGYDRIWFGILFVKMIEIGLVTPPLGLNIFLLSGSVRELKPETVFAGVVPFWLAELATVVLLFAFPAVVLWLPNLMTV